MIEQELNGIFISKPENIRYFSGFSGSSGMLLISDNVSQLLTDFRYVEQATNQAKGFDVIRYSGSVYEKLAESTLKLGLITMGFESDHITYDMFTELSDAMPNVTLVPIQIDTLRMIKDANEVAAITKAVEIADEAFSHILSYVKPGISEQSVALELEYYMGKLGAEKPAFETIVASGNRGALPHGRASNKIIDPGDFVTMDFGAVYQGYHSDITRTICIGAATTKQRRIYEIVLAAQVAGVQAVYPGKTGKTIDAIARKIIVDAGYGEYFGHGLGHSLGLAIHEEPRLSPANTQTVLMTNMVVTVEPGIYLPEWGGVRIEDTVLISADGCQVLTASSKELLEI